MGVTIEQAPEVCAGCHGGDGISLVEDAPNLAGEVNIYIDTQLKAYRIGKRKHEIKTYIAEELTDEESREYADWYSNLELEITPPE